MSDGPRDDWVPTTCVRCAVGCGHVQVEGEDGGVGDARGDTDHPVNEGSVCPRGIKESREPLGNRVLSPMVRRDGELVETDWETALSEVADRFGRILERNRNGVAVLGSGQQTNEAAYQLGKLARAGFGTRYYDANTTLCMASAVKAYYHAFGSDAPPPTYDDIPEADAHVIWGSNPAASHPVMYRWILTSSDSETVTVDPVETSTAMDSDEHVSVEPGGDLALARGVMKRLVETERTDDAFVGAHTRGFDEVVGSLPSVEEAAREAGVSVDDVETLASALEGRALVYWEMGINQNTQGTRTAGALIDLCLATGNVRRGAGPFSVTGQANSMGTRVCSSKGTWPGHRDFGSVLQRQKVADFWGVPRDALADETGPGPVGVVEAFDDEVEACWTVATNPVASLPDSSRAEDRFCETFLVVQDAFRTPTVEHADVVLPAAAWGASEGTIINMERSVSRLRTVTEPRGDTRMDIEIINEVGRRTAPELFDDEVDPEEVFEEFAELTTGTPADLSGISYERLDEEKAVRWPAPDEDSEGGYRYYEEGSGYGPFGASEDWEFETPSGKARFTEPDGSSAERTVPEATDDEYPLTLTTGRLGDAYNSGVRTNEEPRPEEPPVARVNPETLPELGDDSFAVESRRASVGVSVEADEGVPEGVVWLPVHHPSVNRLTVSEVDPVSREPNYKQCAVRLLIVSAEDGEEAPERSEESEGGTKREKEKETEKEKEKEKERGAV